MLMTGGWALAWWASLALPSGLASAQPEGTRDVRIQSCLEQSQTDDFRLGVVSKCLKLAYPDQAAALQREITRRWPYAGCRGGGPESCEKMDLAVPKEVYESFWTNLPPLEKVGPLEQCLRLLHHRREDVAADYCRSEDMRRGVLYADFARPRLCPPGGTKECGGRRIDTVGREEYMPIDLSLAGGPSIEAWPADVTGPDGRSLVAYRMQSIDQRYRGLPYASAVRVCVEDYVVFMHKQATSNVTSRTEQMWRLAGEAVCRAKLRPSVP